MSVSSDCLSTWFHASDSVQVDHDIQERYIYAKSSGYEATPASGEQLLRKGGFQNVDDHPVISFLKTYLTNPGLQIFPAG